MPKRQLVLDAAAALFMAQGYGAVSMDAIARTAGVSKATLYAHFSSKDRLFATIIGEVCRQNDRGGEPAAGRRDGSAQAALTTFAANILRFLLEERAAGDPPRGGQRERALSGARARLLRQRPGAFRRVFGDWLAEQTAAGRLAVPDPGQAADQFIGTAARRPLSAGDARVDASAEASRRSTHP